MPHPAYPRPGPRNLITDVPGLTVGHATDEMARSGVTVLLCPEGWVAAVDVRGGGPGIRESDVLRPENNFSRAHAVTLSGGSVFGLGAADGVVAALSAKGEGFLVRPGAPSVPIVPGAVLYDLANGGDKGWGLDPPYRRLGAEAVDGAGQAFDLGAHGAGRGARAGLVQGGLGAADGVAAALSAAGHGIKRLPDVPAIPIVPGAVLHDLGNGGDKAWGLDPPYRALGLKAVAAANADFLLGSIGAGRGALAGVHKGGIGSASLDLGGGLVVGALAAVNPVGSVYMPGGETFWAWPFEIDGEFGGRAPDPAARAVEPVPDDTKLAALNRFHAGANTTLAVVATTAALTTAEATRIAMMAQDGLARAIRPVHTPFDGDVVFALSSGAVEIEDGPARSLTIARLGSAAADTLARAIARGVFAAG